MRGGSAPRVLRPPIAPGPGSRSVVGHPPCPPPATDDIPPTKPSRACVPATPSPRTTTSSTPYPLRPHHLIYNLPTTSTNLNTPLTAFSFSLSSQFLFPLSVNVFLPVLAPPPSSPSTSGPSFQTPLPSRRGRGVGNLGPPQEPRSRLACGWGKARHPRELSHSGCRLGCQPGCLRECRTDMALQ